MRRYFLPSILLLLLTAPPLLANDDKPWSGEGGVGLIMTTGNSETESFNASLNVVYEKSRWRHSGGLQALYSAKEVETETGDEEMQTSAEKYRASVKTDYKFTENNYAFFTGSYEDDRFSGYDYQATVAAGYGRRLLETERFLLEAEIGPGYRYSRLEESGETEDEAILRAYTLFSAELTETSAFKQELSVEAGSDRTVTTSISSVQANIIGALSMKASYTLEHTSSVPEGTEKTDTETALTLVYTF